MRIKIAFIGLLAACSMVYTVGEMVKPLPSPSPPVVHELTFQAHDFQVTNLQKIDVAKAQVGVSQDSTGSNSTGTKTFWDGIKDNIGALIFAFLALLEIIFRATPTQSDNSILNLIKKILDTLIPNKDADGGVHQ